MFKIKIWMIISVLSESDHNNQWEMHPGVADGAAKQQ